MLQILGNKSLKIKYLNPSAVFIATGPPTGTLSEDLDSSSIMLTVQIVDTVTGAPIYRQVHKVKPYMHCWHGKLSCLNIPFPHQDAQPSCFTSPRIAIMGECAISHPKLLRSTAA